MRKRYVAVAATAIVLGVTAVTPALAHNEARAVTFAAELTGTQEVTSPAGPP